MKHLRVLLAVLCTGLLLTACGGSESPPAPTSLPASSTPSPAPPTATAPPPATGVPAGTPGAPATWPADAAAAIAKAQQAVAQTAQVDPAAVTVVSVTAHDWPTPALGCEQAGHAYLQVITPGYILVLEAGGTRYTYHADRKGHVATCPAAS